MVALKPFQTMMREAYCKLGEWRSVDIEPAKVKSIWVWYHYDSNCPYTTLESIYMRVVNIPWRYKK